jgi:hypothetical protein
MRRACWMLVTLAVASAEFLGCSNSTSDGTLAFPIAESLLVVLPSDPTHGSVVLSSGTGTCAHLQSGLNFDQIASSNFLYFLLEQLDASNAPQPLTGGGYTILDPDNSSFNGPGFIANAIIETTDASCVPNGSSATGGTVTVSLSQSVDGGGSSVSYSAIFDGTKITGNYALSSCPLDESVPPAPAGTCVPP